MVKRKPDPKQLVTWAITGALIAASTWFLSFAHIPRLTANGEGFWAVLWVNRLRFIAYFAPFAIGLALSLWAEHRFKGGLKGEIWSEAELEPVRAMVAKPLWSWTSWLLIGAAVVAMILFAFTAGTGHMALLYLLFYPIQTAARLRQLLTPKITTGGLKDWQNFQPIHSDHWGEPPLHPSE
jgi:hypothetical protein